MNVAITRRRSGASLGVAPLVVAEAPAILNAIKSLFQGSSYDATHQQLLTWAQTILADPSLSTAAAQAAYVGVRCWAGDQTMQTAFANTFHQSVANGCGCEVDHGCRADAQSVLATLLAHIPTLPSPAQLSSAPVPSQEAGYTPPVATYPGNPLTSGLLPIGTGATLGGAVGGVPVWILALGALVGVVALQGKGR